MIRLLMLVPAMITIIALPSLSQSVPLRAEMNAVDDDQPARCSLDLLRRNADNDPEVSLDSTTLIVTSPDPSRFITSQIHVPCTPSELLKLGFDLRSATRFGPESSTNAAFEGIDVFQRDDLLVACYFEYELTERSRTAAISWSRLACSQTVPVRLANIPVSGFSMPAFAVNVCPFVFAPVCGSDDQMYTNSCFAELAGVDVVSQGQCNGLATE